MRHNQKATTRENKAKERSKLKKKRQADRLAGGLNKYQPDRNGVWRQRRVGRGKDGLKLFFYSSILNFDKVQVWFRVVFCTLKGRLPPILTCTAGFKAPNTLALFGRSVIFTPHPLPPPNLTEDEDG